MIPDQMKHGESKDAYCFLLYRTGMAISRMPTDLSTEMLLQNWFLPVIRIQKLD